MWIEDVNGDLVNLDNCKIINVYNGFISAESKKKASILFEGNTRAECQAYMEQLKKELAAFGKLVKVVLSE